MAGAEEQGFTRRGIAPGDFVRGPSPGEALDIGDRAPDIVGRQRTKTGHLGAGDSGADGLEQVIVTRAVAEPAAIQRRPAPAGGAHAMTGGAGGIENLLACRDRGRVIGKGVAWGVGRLGYRRRGCHEQKRTGLGRKDVESTAHVCPHYPTVETACLLAPVGTGCWQAESLWAMASPFTVMAGPDPAIHLSTAFAAAMDGRLKGGHDRRRCFCRKHTYVVVLVPLLT